MRRAGPAALATGLAGGLYLVLVAAFVVLRLAGPYDGALLGWSRPDWNSGGVALVAPQPAGSLHDGDVVVAMDGVSLSQWAARLLHWPPALGLPGNAISELTVRREGQIVTVPVAHAAYPLANILAQNPSALLLEAVALSLGIFTFARRPYERPARVFFIWTVSLTELIVWSLGVQPSDLTGTMTFWLFRILVSGGYLLLWAASLHFALAFPRPHPLLGRRGAAVALYAIPFLFFLGWLAVAARRAPDVLAWLGRWEMGLGMAAGAYLLLSFAAVLHSFRRVTDPVGRQQARLVVGAFLISGGAILALWVIPANLFGRPLLPPGAVGLVGLPFPVALAIAVLRYRLFDIDLVINRTLVYGILSALLASVYFGLVVLLQRLLDGLTSQHSQVAVVLSTIAIAGLFQPLRAWLQALVDRQFYRRKYDAARMLAAFGATLRDEVDLNALTDHLLAVVEETMEPAHISLWLATGPSKGEIVAGDAGEAERATGQAGR